MCRCNDRGDQTVEESLELMQLCEVFALAVLAGSFTIAGFCLVVEGRAVFAEPVDLVPDLFEQLHLPSMVGRLELRAGDSTIGDDRFAIQKLN